MHVRDFRWWLYVYAWEWGTGCLMKFKETLQTTRTLQSTARRKFPEACNPNPMPYTLNDPLLL